MSSEVRRTRAKRQHLPCGVRANVLGSTGPYHHDRLLVQRPRSVHPPEAGTLPHCSRGGQGAILPGLLRLPQSETDQSEQDAWQRCAASHGEAHRKHTAKLIQTGHHQAAGSSSTGGSHASNSPGYDSFKSSMISVLFIVRKSCVEWYWS